MNGRNQGPDASSTGAPSAPAPWILIADDDDVVRKLWSDVLTGAGYRTLKARTGREALDLIRAVVPDLVILDLRMPEFSGGDVLRELQKSGVLRFMPVLVVSGFLEQEPYESEGLNIVGYLPKPLGARDLRNAVSAALGLRPEPRSTT